MPETFADPMHLLRTRPMRGVQILAVALCIAATMVDGFDILAASFTAPAIARDWSLDPVRVGVLLSAGLAGMVGGALFLAPLADVFGRRRVILVCLMVAALGLFASSLAPDLAFLTGSRLVTGAGIAAVMAAANTVVAENANDRRRDLAIVLQATGFPLGGALGGIGVLMAPGVDWRFVFGVGGAITLGLTVLLAIGLPESLDFLIGRRPANALARANRLLTRLGLPALGVLPERPERRPGEARLRGRDGWVSTLLICSSFFLLMFSFYFLTSWTPKLLTDYGLSRQVGVSGSMFMNLGGVSGDLLFAVLVVAVPARRLGPVFLIGAFAAAAAFAFVPLTLGALMPTAFAIGALLYGAMASLYAVTPALFGASVRNTGTGVALGLGRIGAAAGPYVGGLLIAARWTRPQYLLVMSAPLIGCAVLALILAPRAHALAEP